jgi:alpha-galactosidase
MRFGDSIKRGSRATAGFATALALWTCPLSIAAGPLQTPAQIGNILKMTNANVRIDYDLSTGRANFFWQNGKKIAGFYAGVGLYDHGVLTNYVTGTVYSNRTWTVSSNTVEITLTGGGLPLMKQSFILDQDNSFLTRAEMTGTGLESRWMGPLVMDTAGGADIGTNNDNRALTLPFDNDSFTFSYNAMPINNTSMSYEVAAFYDNTTRNGLVVGSVTHDTWKTGVYFQGANNKLSVLNVFGGVASSDTRDVLEHGLVKGSTILSPTAFVGFNPDWRTAMESFGDANAAIAPRLIWNGGPPFGWNSWYAYATSVNYSNAIAASTFIKNFLQTNHFSDRGAVYINLDSFWSNLSDAELSQFSSFCHTNGQKAGIYWTPFVYWGTASQGSNSFMTGSASYKWSDAYLRATNAAVQTLDGGIALDPTHPGFKQMTAYYINFFKSRGFDFLKLDFLSHGALEGTHYDTNVTTGIQAYNQGLQYLVAQNSGRMFLSASIAPIFPSQYTHSRRIYCDAASSISDTAATMQAVNYGWWINGRLYQFSDPDMMKFSGGTANENQSRLINGAVAGTVFLNSDDLASATGQNLAGNCLTNANINEIARAGISFRPVEGNTGTNATDVFVRHDGSTWYVAVFNYTSSPTFKTLNFARLGISGAYTAQDLWSGALSTITGPTWIVTLGARQAKLFRLGTGPTTALGPTNQALVTGDSTTFSTIASGAPPFSYIWKKNGVVVSGQNASSLTLSSVNLNDAGTYSVQVTGGNGTVTNSAVLTLLSPTNLSATIVGEILNVSWPAGYVGWRLQTQTNTSGAGIGTNWFDVANTASTNVWSVSIDAYSPGAFFRLIYP